MKSYKFQNFFIKKFLEARGRNADVNFVVYLDGNARGTAFAYAKAAVEHDLVFKIFFFYRFLEKFYYLLRTLEMAGASHTDLYY